MAFHQKISKNLLNMDKHWSDLKQSQKEWIHKIVEHEYKLYILNHNSIPIKKYKIEIVENTYERIKQKEVWIPYQEAKIHINKKIDRLNRKYKIEVHDMTSEMQKELRNIFVEAGLMKDEEDIKKDASDRTNRDLAIELKNDGFTIEKIARLLKLSVADTIKLME